MESDHNNNSTAKTVGDILLYYGFVSSRYTTSLYHQKQFSCIQNSWDVLGMTEVSKANAYNLQDFEKKMNVSFHKELYFFKIQTVLRHR